MLNPFFFHKVPLTSTITSNLACFRLAWARQVEGKWTSVDKQEQVLSSSQLDQWGMALLAKLWDDDGRCLTIRLENKLNILIWLLSCLDHHQYPIVSSTSPVGWLNSSQSRIATLAVRQSLGENLGHEGYEAQTTPNHRLIRCYHVSTFK